ncbi:hypothetical protein V6Z11_D04G028000 [Gossypium hirsutum]
MLNAYRNCPLNAQQKIERNIKENLMQMLFDQSIHSVDSQLDMLQNPFYTTFEQIGRTIPLTVTLIRRTFEDDLISQHFLIHLISAPKQVAFSSICLSPI